jgi:outer membrane protein assembly factor BamB
VIKIVTALILAATAVHAQDWPEFRGPTAQGLSRESGLPVEWGPGKNVAWKQAIPGGGWSSPVISRGRIYLTSAIPVEGTKDFQLAALCLDAKTGNQLWKSDVFLQDAAAAPPIHKMNSHASPTPIVDGDRLFVHFGHQGTACLDLDGKVLWRFRSPKFDPEDGNGGSPILVDRALVFNCDGKDLQFVLALDRSTGDVLWKTERRSPAQQKFSYCTPLLITVDGEKQIIDPGAGAVCAYDPKSGRELWRVGYGEGYSVVPRPVFGHGLLFICTGFEKPGLLAIRPDGQGDVTATHVAWSVRKGVPLIASPLLVGDELYLISDAGVASCLDARTGKEQWQQRICGKPWASPLFADGRIYFQDLQGLGVVVKAGRSYEPLARNSLEERTFSSYAVSDGAIFIRTEKQLYRIQAR